MDRTGLFVAPLPGATPQTAQGTSPTDGRLVLGALFSATGGCVAGGAFVLSNTLMQLTVAASVWRIPDPNTAGATYLSPADSATVTFTASPSSGSRIDVIWVRQNNYEASDANSRVVYGVATGTAGANPTAPSIPAGAMAIGTLTVPANASNTNACTLVSTYGALSAPRADLVVGYEAGLPSQGAYYGQLAYVTNVTLYGYTQPVIERWNGSAWKRWESEFFVYRPNVGGLAGNLDASPGWNPGGRFRFTGGKVLFEWNFALNYSGTTSTGTITISLPVNADLATSPQNGRAFQDLYSLRGAGTARFVSNNNRLYPLFHNLVSSSQVAIGNINSAGYFDGSGGSSPSSWAGGDSAVGVLEYDPV